MVRQRAGGGGGSNAAMQKCASLTQKGANSVKRLSFDA
jgi:hypothetical protein